MGLDETLGGMRYIRSTSYRILGWNSFQLENGKCPIKGGLLSLDLISTTQNSDKIIQRGKEQYPWYPWFPYVDLESNFNFHRWNGLQDLFFFSFNWIYSWKEKTRDWWWNRLTQGSQTIQKLDLLASCFLQESRILFIFGGQRGDQASPWWRSKGERHQTEWWPEGSDYQIQTSNLSPWK